LNKFLPINFAEIPFSFKENTETGLTKKERSTFINKILPEIRESIELALKVDDWLKGTLGSEFYVNAILAGFQSSIFRHNLTILFYSNRAKGIKKEIREILIKEFGTKNPEKLLSFDFLKPFI